MFEPAKIIRQFAEDEELDLNFDVKKLATRLARAHTADVDEYGREWQQGQDKIDDQLDAEQKAALASMKEEYETRIGEVRTLLTRAALNQNVNNGSLFCWWQQALLKLLPYIPHK